MALVRNIIARIQALFAWWIADIRRRPSLIGKAASLGIGLLAICCVCSLPVTLMRRPSVQVSPTVSVSRQPTATPEGLAVAVQPSAAPELPTAAPAPTALPEPSTTPVPEPSTTPVPEPSATSEPPTATAGITSEERAAVLKISEHVSAIGKALQTIGTLAQNYENTGEWKTSMVIQMAIVRLSHESIQKLDVPPKVSGIQTATVNATTDCNAAMDKIASGIDNNSATDFNKAGALMASCGEKIKGVLPEIQALQ